ncbi:unnamed protein product [Sphacelaria rigidula]
MSCFIFWYRHFQRQPRLIHCLMDALPAVDGGGGGKLNPTLDPRYFAPPEVGVTVPTRLSRRIIDPSVVVVNSLCPHVGADASWCWGRQRTVRTAAVGVCGCVVLHAGVWVRVMNSAHIAQRVSLLGSPSRGLVPWVLGMRHLVLRSSVVLCGAVIGGLIFPPLLIGSLGIL